VRWCLTRLDLSAGKLPESAERLIGSSLRDEDETALVVDDQAGDDQFSRQ
jgi:hypothetical protein